MLYPRFAAFCLLIACLAFVSSMAAQPDEWRVSSPNGKITAAVRLAELAGHRDYHQGRRLYYCVNLAGRTVIFDSPLGLALSDADMIGGLEPVDASPPKLIVERYTAPHGKRRQRSNRAHEITLAFKGESRRTLEIDFRAYDDGVAFRYRLPKSPATTVATLKTEATGFALPTNGFMWAHPADNVTAYSPAYETYYENEVPVGTPSPLSNGWSFPILFRNSDASVWALLTEAGVGTNFCGMRLEGAAPAGVYRMRFPEHAEGNNTGSVFPVSSMPWEMPWRVIIIGDSPGAIVESTLVEDVSPPSILENIDWVKPGRVAWSWWSDPDSPRDAAKQKLFVDFAAEMGWEYVLVDANWTIIDNGSLHDVLRHAKAMGIGILLWYNSGGPHNIVTEKPRDCMTYREVRRFELELLKKWGVRGVKVDFFQSDKQNIIALYHDILRDAADYQIMVNFHGCTLPRGWSRTYPHLMSMEAVRGAENYIFAENFPKRAPVQNTITPFTRNAVGPMDYTPVAFTAHNHPHRTTFAHELALAALFESAWVHFADKPEAYRALPPEPKQFLKELPVAWDDTRFVAGYPGQYVVLARRKGQAWYLAGVNGQDRPREVNLKLGPWLADGMWDMTLIADGPDARSFDTSGRTIDRRDEPVIRMLPYGGFVAIMKPRQ